ncbi:MAG TPA: 16S rRNA (guanine(966)-N(2))-methyltransferase RsmD [Candidatus Acidoferrum sp.]|nr:16S rRNA (guanine(966)-N(2))-methyltransferase RsmD [Candidatus Acidoferrum sp.]
MRIIAGKFRSRQLKSLKGLTLRPTSDRLRETLFNILGELVVDSRFVDTFAGTGAVGIEAFSRGAKEVIFIENHAKAAAVIKQNLETLEAKNGTRVLPVEALKGLQSLSKEKSSNIDQQQIVFLDPPYDNAADYDRVLTFLGSATLLSENSLVIAEHRSKFELPEIVENLQRVRVLGQGDASLSFYRLRKNSSTSGPDL